MIVAGFGFRAGATLAALKDALARAGGPERVTHLATVAAKAEGLLPLAQMLGLPVIAVAAEDLSGQTVLTHSERVDSLFGTGSLAEAAALAAAGPGARLWGARVVSTNGTATAAIAEGDAS